MYTYHCTGGFVRYSFPKLLLNKRAVAGCSTAEEFIFLTCQKGTSDENRWTVKLNFRTIIKRGAAMEGSLGVP